MSKKQWHEEIHARAQLRGKYWLTQPPQVRDSLQILGGDKVAFTVHTDGQVTLRGMTSIPADQRWFWTEEWQAGERESSEQIVAGNLEVYDDMAAPDQPTIVAAIVTSPRGVLLARRHDGKPEWTFPGGAQEAGEDYADTAAREALEETGLAVIARNLIGERTHPTTGRHMVYIAADPVNGIEVRVGDSDEHSHVGWYPWAMAEGMLPHLFEPVADHLRTTLPA